MLAESVLAVAVVVESALASAERALPNALFCEPRVRVVASPCLCPKAELPRVLAVFFVFLLFFTLRVSAFEALRSAALARASEAVVRPKAEFPCPPAPKPPPILEPPPPWPPPPPRPASAVEYVPRPRQHAPIIANFCAVLNVIIYPLVEVSFYRQGAEPSQRSSWLWRNPRTHSHQP